jgi:hypothetical protein
MNPIQTEDAWLKATLIIVIVACGILIANAAFAQGFQPPAKNRWNVSDEIGPLELDAGKKIAHLQADFLWYFDNWPKLKAAHDSALVQVVAQTRRAETCESALALVRVSEAHAWQTWRDEHKAHVSTQKINRVTVIAALAAILAETVFLSVMIGRGE